MSLLPQRVHADARGELVAFEEFENVPFVPKRVFVVKVDAPGPARGGHANSCDELITVLSGAVTVEVDNGSERATVRLAGHDEALWIQGGILIRLCGFVPSTILLVCASERYKDTQHYDEARPDLMRAACPA
ncbi:sugar 3,4-ketoisomerase [Methylobacterium nodulans]|uniref:sugar 3,4-ketoisomerase n=1 Tax=Methylobacterium nodulans TaxID=114616 RepID=UPI00031D335C|nr:FdtA/QdtA family cupin domain-containing protein [Methylobacterium nodulans]